MVELIWIDGETSIDLKIQGDRNTFLQPTFYFFSLYFLAILSIPILRIGRQQRANIMYSVFIQSVLSIKKSILFWGRSSGNLSFFFAQHRPFPIYKSVGFPISILFVSSMYQRPTTT